MRILCEENKLYGITTFIFYTGNECLFESLQKIIL